MSARANVACKVFGFFTCLLGLFISVLGLLKDLVAPSLQDPLDPPQNYKTLFMDHLPLEMRLEIYKLSPRPAQGAHEGQPRAADAKP